MKVYDKNLKAHKITNTFYLIIIIPFLLLALLSATIMFNAKMAGGYANIFRYYVVELQNDNFYNEETGEFKNGTKQMFKAVSYETLKEGDIVVCYSGDTTNKIDGVPSSWGPTSASFSFLTESSNTTQQISPVKIVKIGPQKADITNSSNKNEKYTVFSYYESKDGPLLQDNEHFIVGEDIIGIAVPTSEFLANAINYAKTADSLLILVLLPCALLLIIKIMSISFYKKYENSLGLKRTGKVVDEENMSYAQVINANRARSGAPQRPPRTAPTQQSTNRTRTTRTTTSIQRRATPQQPSKRTPPKRPTSAPKRPTRKS